MTDSSDKQADVVELLPCPFCGGSDVSSDCSGENDFDVTCWSCKAGAISCGPSKEDRASAIAAWNTRAIAAMPDQSAEVERWLRAYQIAFDQAMDNGERLQRASAELAAAKLENEKLRNALGQLQDYNHALDNDYVEEVVDAALQPKGTPE